MSEGMSEYYFDYNDRYGIKNNRAWIPTAVILAIIFGGWLLWSASFHSKPAISYQVISFNDADARNVELRYSVTRRDPSKVATCVLVARNYDKVVVGQINDHIAAGTDGYIEHIVTIPSRDNAVNASVISCHID